MSHAAQAAQVDHEIDATLQRLVEFLDLDCSTLLGAPLSSPEPNSANQESKPQ